ncbi:hypothetical protein [Nocardioides sp.]|uniref:hypothetical protein n=1 Tax=Nocardioides sp. TaxID=35761 RepID=UPI00260619ED|nr:hypothetical protein [Nocardioides sp.]MDI6910940.1 hypothetical protein [Nocardioides sp.]
MLSSSLEPTGERQGAVEPDTWTSLRTGNSTTGQPFAGYGMFWTLANAYDAAKLEVVTGSGTTTLATWSNLNKAPGYQLRTFNLASHQGSSITLRFTGVEDYSLQTSFVVDDVTLNVS